MSLCKVRQHEDWWKHSWKPFLHWMASKNSMIHGCYCKPHAYVLLRNSPLFNSPLAEYPKCLWPPLQGQSTWVKCDIWEVRGKRASSLNWSQLRYLTLASFRKNKWSYEHIAWVLQGLEEAVPGMDGWSLKLKLHGDSAFAHDACIQALSRIQVLPPGRPCPFLRILLSRYTPTQTSHHACSWLCALSMLFSLPGMPSPTSSPESIYPSFRTRTGVISSVRLVIPDSTGGSFYFYHSPHNTMVCVCLSHQHVKPLGACDLFLYPSA